MNDEGLADAGAASPFHLPRLHPGIAQDGKSRDCCATTARRVHAEVIRLLERQQPGRRTANRRAVSVLLGAQARAVRSAHRVSRSLGYVRKVTVCRSSR
jgi:hypothetical protein